MQLRGGADPQQPGRLEGVIGSLAYALSDLDLRHGWLAEVAEVYAAHHAGHMASLNEDWLAGLHDRLWSREEWLLTGAMQSDVYEGGE